MIDDDEVCLRERYAEDRSTCGCAKCRASLATDTDELLVLGKGITEEFLSVIIWQANSPRLNRAIAAVPRLFARIEHDAATIAELRAEVVRKDAALQKIAAGEVDGDLNEAQSLFMNARRMALAALKPTSNERDG